MQHDPISEPHDHHPYSATERASAASRSTWVSVVVNVVLTVVQIVVGVLSKSQALAPSAISGKKMAGTGG